MGPVRAHGFGRISRRRDNRSFLTRLWAVALLTALLTALPVGLVAAKGPGSGKGKDKAATAVATQESTEASEPAADQPEDQSEEPAPAEEQPADTDASDESSQGGETQDEAGTTDSGEAETTGAEESGSTETTEKAEKTEKDKPGDPPGNNGTVKIDGIPFDDHPDNEPHVGCVFQIDFYGYDEGDLDATWILDLQSPSGRGTIASGSVFIGEDEAGGGTDLDASVTVDLTEALAESDAYRHPQQGYHIKLTVHAEGSIGADVKHKVFWVDCGEEAGGVTAEQEVIKVWLDQEGNEVEPPEDLSPSFRIVLEDMEDDGTLTCRITDEGVSCTGDLEVTDGETVTVTEINAPEGWAGPDTATADCETTETEDGGTHISCTIAVANVFSGEVGGITYSREVVKTWIGADGEETATPPADLSTEFEIVIKGEDGQLSCVYDGDDLVCTGDLVVQDGEEVTVVEKNVPEGWLGPDEAVAECETTETAGGGTHTACTIALVNLFEEVGGEIVIREVVKVWVDDDGASTVPPAGLPASFRLVLTGAQGSLTCLYQEGQLTCAGDLVVEDGDVVTVSEVGLTEGWEGPDTATADCVTVENETTCTIAVRNVFTEVGGDVVTPPGGGEEVAPGVVTAPSLAVTGLDAGRLVAVAAILLAMGTGLLYVARRRGES